MAPRFDIQVCSLINHAVPLGTQAVEHLKTAVDSSRSTTARAASDAAVSSNRTMISNAWQSIERLQRTVSADRRLVDVDDTYDLSSARALGE